MAEAAHSGTDGTSILSRYVFCDRCGQEIDLDAPETPRIEGDYPADTIFLHVLLEHPRIAQLVLTDHTPKWLLDWALDIPEALR